MKKFYFFLIAAITVALTSTAISLNGLKAAKRVNRVAATAQVGNPVKKADLSMFNRNTTASPKVQKTARKATDVIFTPPAGETKYYTRTGGAYYVSSSSLYEGEQEGTIEVVFTEDGKVYFKNLICYYATGTYVEGDVVDGEIHIPVGQTLYSWADYGYGAELNWINYDGATPSAAEIDYDNDEAIFLIDEATGELSLQNSDANHVLGVNWDDDLTWTGRGDYNTVLVPLTDLPTLVVPPAGIAPETYYYTGSSSYDSKLSTTVNIVKDGNDYYIQGLATYIDEDEEYFADAWVKGTLDGDKLTIEKNQYIGNYGSYFMYLVASDNETGLTDIVFTYDAEVDAFTLDADYYVNASNERVYYLAYYQAGNIISKEEAIVPEVVTPPAELETTDWSFTAQEVSFDEDENPVYSDYNVTVKVGFDGNDFYIQGLCEELPEAWVKGTISGDVAVMPTGQFFGNYYEEYWGYVLADNDHYLVGYGEGGIEDIILEVQNEGKTLVASNWILDNGSATSVTYYHIFTEGVFNEFDDVAAKPAEPEVLSFKPFSSYAYIEMNIPATDVDGNPLNTNKLYYRIYSDIEKDIQQLSFTPEDYTYLDEELTEIPYSYSDDYDIYKGGSLVYINHSNFADFNQIGVQTVYYGGMGVPSNPVERTVLDIANNESSIVWFKIKDYAETGIIDVAKTKQLTGVRYYNVNGQSSDKPFSGINIIVRSYSDGSTVTTKGIKK